MGVALLVVAVAVLALWLSWNRLLGWLVTRASRSSKFRLAVDSISLSGILGVQVDLPQGPIKSVSVQRLCLGGAGGEAGREGGGFVQSLLSGSLRLPLVAQGVAVKLREAPAATSAPTSTTECKLGGADGDGQQGGGEGISRASDDPGGTSSTSGSQGSGSKFKFPLGLLQAVSFRLEGLTVHAEGLGIWLQLQQASLALSPTQQISLTSLAVLLDAQGVSSSQQQPQPQQQLLHIESLMLSHTHATSGLAWLHETSWQLGRLAFSLGTTVLASPPEVAERLVPLLRRGGSHTNKSKPMGAAARSRGCRVAPAALLARLPKEVDVVLDSVRLDASAFQLHAAAAVRQFRLQAVLSTWGQQQEGGDGLQGQQQQASGASPGPATPRSPRHPQLPSLQPPPPLAVLSAGWRSFECSVGAEQPWAPAQAAGGPPAALALCCQVAEVRVQLDDAAYEASGASMGGEDGGSRAAAAEGGPEPAQRDAGTAMASTEGALGLPPRVLLVLDSSLDAVHTSVGHEAVPGVLSALAALRPPSKAAEPAAEVVDRQPGMGADGCDAPETPQAANRSLTPGVQLGWHARLQLGQESSLRFVDASGTPQWVSSFQVAKLRASQAATAEQGEGPSHPHSHTPSSEDAGPLPSSSSGLSIEVEVQDIVMQAAHAGAQHEGQHELPQMLATRLLRFSLAPERQKADAEQGQQQQLGSFSMEGAATPLQGELSAIGLRTVLQQATLATLTTVASALVPPPALLWRPPAAEAASAAAVAAPAGAGVPARRNARRGLAVAGVSVCFSDTAVVLPHGLRVPAHQGIDGKEALLQAATVLVVDRVSASLSKHKAGQKAALEQLDVLYCEHSEGPCYAFPDSLQDLRGGAKVSLASLASLKLGPWARQPSKAQACLAGGALPRQTASGRDSGVPAQRLSLGRVRVNLDADALLSVAEVAGGILSLKELLPPRAGAGTRGEQDSQVGGGQSLLPLADAAAAGAGATAAGAEVEIAAGGAAVAGAAEAQPSAILDRAEGVEGAFEPDAEDVVSRAHSSSTAGEAGSGGLVGPGPASIPPTAAPLQPTLPRTGAPLGSSGSGVGSLWVVELERCSVALPLSQQFDLAFEVGSVSGQWQRSQGRVAVESTALAVNGKPVIKLGMLDAELELPQGSPGARLPLCPLALTLHPSYAGTGQAAAAAAAGAAEARPPGSAAAGSGLGCKAGANDDGLTIPAVLSSETAAGTAGGVGLAEDPKFTPYYKARLHSWLSAAEGSSAGTAGAGASASAASPAPPTTVLSGGATAVPAAAAQPPGNAGSAQAATEGDSSGGSLGAGPCSVVHLGLASFELCLPHDREPGPCQRYAEMYFKALALAMEDKLQQLRQLMPPAAAQGAREAPQHAKRTKHSLFPMQLNLTAGEVVVRFEHHPMEAWFAVHGPLLQKLAVQRHLWTDIACAVQPAEPTAPLHAAMVETAFANAGEAGQRAWEGVMGDLAQMYRTLQQQAILEAKGHEGDLMHIRAEAVQALAVVCGGDAAGTAAALQTVHSVDPASKGVQLIQARKIHADVAVKGFAMYIATAEQPFVAAASAQVSGVLAVARQATAPPQQLERRLPVGAHRSVPIGVTVKGSRAPFKLYTDLHADLRNLSVSYSQGHEPTLMLLGMAGKRLAPTDPDKSVPRPPPIPWWDDLRYMWRGMVGLRAQGFQFAMALGAQPTVDETTERMLVEAGTVTGQLLSGDYTLEAQSLTATLFEGANLDQPAGTLLELPFARFPDARFRLKLDWKLPGGRAAAEHHLFPPVPLAGGQLQGPVVLAEEYKSSALDLCIEVQLRQPQHSQRGLQGMGQGAVGFLGDHQVQYMRSFVLACRQPPPWLRSMVKTGTYFVRKPPAAAPKKGIPKLLQQLDVVVSATPIDVVHFTVKSGDPSSSVCISAANCAFAGCWLLNQPLPSFLKTPPNAKGKRVFTQPLTRTVSKDFRVSADDVRIHRFDGSEGPGGSMVAGGDKLGRRSATGGDVAHVDFSARKQELVAQPSLLTHLFSSGPFTGGKDTGRRRHIGSAASVGVSSSGSSGAGGSDAAAGVSDAAKKNEPDGSDPDDPDGSLSSLEPSAKRPLTITIRDCKFLVDLAARNAIWGVIDHLVNAFVLPPATTAANAAAAAVLTPTPSTISPSRTAWSSHLSPVAQMQRRMSGGPSALSPARSEGEGQNELLSLLLLQREDKGDGSGGLASPQTEPGGEQEEEESGDEAPLMSTAVDDAHSVLKYEIEVVNLQINVEAEAAQGRFLLAAKSGRVAGRTPREAALNITTMQLEQVQAYVARTDIDPDASVAWLDTRDGEFKAPDEDISTLRRVFNPIRIDMRHSKVVSAAARQLASRNSMRGRAGTPVGSGSHWGQQRGEELVFKVPEIICIMSSREFEILVDVISNVGMAQPPAMDNINAEAELLLEVEGGEVEDARQMYAMVRQQLAAARQEALQVRSGIGLRMVRSTGGVTGSGTAQQAGAALLRFAAAESEAQAAMRFLGAAELAVALREHLGAAAAAQELQPAASSGEGGVSAGAGEGPLAGRPEMAAGAAVMVGAQDSEQPPTPTRPVAAATALLRRQEEGLLRGRQLLRAQQQALALLLRWVEEQEEEAVQTFEKAKAALISLKAVARKRQPSRHASRVLLQVDRVVWQLCTGPSREGLFVQASIRHISMDILRNKDRSGSAKFMIHRIEVMDSQGSLEAAPGTGAGVILSVWNPSVSWERDPMVRVNATMGVPTKTHIIYDLLDVTVHPLGLHLTEAIAVKFWEYFFPKEEDAAQRQVKFAQSVAVPASAAVRHRRAVTALPTEWDYAGGQGSLGRESTLESGGGSGSSIGSEEHPAKGAGWKAGGPSRLHRRSSSASGMDAAGSAGITPTSSNIASQASLAQALAEKMQQQGAAGLGQGSGEGGFAAGGQPQAPAMAAAAAAATAPASEPSAGSIGAIKVPGRKTRFVYVRVNRAHCRVTYEGYPVSFSDLKFVSDNMTYENLEGRWRDLFNRMKWDAIKSAVKSMAGLQGKKFKELLPGDMWDEGSRGMGKGHSLMASLGLVKPKASRDEGLTEEEAKAKQKKRMLFGEQHVARSGPAAGAGASSTRSPSKLQPGGVGAPAVMQPLAAVVPAAPAGGPAGAAPVAGGAGAAGVGTALPAAAAGAAAQRGGGVGADTFSAGVGGLQAMPAGAAAAPGAGAGAGPLLVDTLGAVGHLPGQAAPPATAADVPIAAGPLAAGALAAGMARMSPSPHHHHQQQQPPSPSWQQGEQHQAALQQALQRTSFGQLPPPSPRAAFGAEAAAFGGAASGVPPLAEQLAQQQEQAQQVQRSSVGSGSQPPSRPSSMPASQPPSRGLTSSQESEFMARASVDAGRGRRSSSGSSKGSKWMEKLEKSLKKLTK